jgi:hypothetical protein
MSPFDGVDSFHACRLDTSHGVGTIQSLSEDSIQQYLQAQLQRHIQARQRIEQKDTEAENVKESEKVQATISEDTADGKTAKLDASLKFLSDDKINLLIPSDELEAAESVKYRRLFEKRLRHQERLKKLFTSVRSQSPEGHYPSKMPPKRKGAGSGSRAKKVKRGKGHNIQSLHMGEGNVADGNNLNADQDILVEVGPNIRGIGKRV